MKTLVMAVAFLLTAGMVSAQLRKVPAEVTDAFKAKYPDARQVEWKDKLTRFDVDFVSNNLQSTASFSNDGKWQKTEQKMEFENLPATVKDGFNKSKYNDWTPGSVTKISSADEGIQYKVYAEKSSIVQKKFLYFNEQGQLIKDTPGI